MQVRCNVFKMAFISVTQVDFVSSQSKLTLFLYYRFFLGLLSASEKYSHRKTFGFNKNFPKPHMMLCGKSYKHK